MKRAIYFLVLVLLVPGVAQARCPASDIDCTSDDFEKKFNERIDQGQKDVWNADSASGKAKAVGDTIEDCFDCAMDAAEDSISGTAKGR